MVKPSILFTLLLGLVLGFSSNLASGADNPEEDVTHGENSDANKANEDSADKSPDLTCLLFDELGCDTKCSITASAFSLEGIGQCTDEEFCQCTLEQDNSLEGLFRAKFDAEDALEKIKKDKELSAKVLEILKVPFQTINQTKRQLRKVVYPAIYDQLLINDKTPTWELGLVGETDNLYYDKIKEYVSEKLKPILISSSKKLARVKYETIMKKSLKQNTDEDLQSIISEVRRTKNKNLNDILDDYLKSAKVEEENSTKKDNIADAIGHQVIDLFLHHIEQNKKPAAKKPARKLSTKNNKKTKAAGRKSTN